MALKLPLNQPVSLSLTRPDPKHYAASAGKPACVMYSVALPDGTEDKLFLPPSCGQSLDALQLRPQEPFVVCRRKTPAGAEYIEVQTSAKSVSSRDLAPAPAPVPAPPATPKPMQTASEIHPARASQIMGAALIAALDATQLAQEYAVAKGLTVEFGPEDVRAIANTMYIQACRDPLFQERMHLAAA